MLNRFYKPCQEHFIHIFLFALYNYFFSLGGMMITNKIFQKNPYLKALESSVSSLNCDKKTAKLILTDTIFFPTGGGQSCDKGFIKFNENKYPVIDVYEAGKEVVHVISIEKNRGKLPEEGAKIALEIDWKHRFDNMQRHCGEHILSGVIYKLFQGTNKGFHMGEEYITIDIDFSQSDYSKLTWQMAEKAELEANKVIWKGASVHTDYFDNRELASGLPLRKPLAFDEDISIVTIGDFSEPDDCVACCGTHPRFASEVGLLKIYKIESNKGMSRIYFEAGNRAFNTYQKQFNTLYDMSLRLSTSTTDIANAYESQLSHINELKKQLSNFRGSAIIHEIQEIISKLMKKNNSSENPKNDDCGNLKNDGCNNLKNEACNTQSKEKSNAGEQLEFESSVSVFNYTEFSVDDILNISKKLFILDKDNNCIKNHLIAMVCASENTIILLSDGSKDTRNCAKLAELAREKFQGKGGGKPVSARIYFPDRNNLDKFIKYISQSSTKNTTTKCTN